MPEYIVINLVNDVVIVHHHPSKGGYRTHKIHRRGDTLHISAGKGKIVEIEVAKLL